MATAQNQKQTGTTGTTAQPQATERKAQGQLVSSGVAAATNGLAGGLEAAAKERIQYDQ
jgi:hypothetical protein